jgi:RNA polymerase sigma-70 factor (ECF subfamily)
VAADPALDRATVSDGSGGGAAGAFTCVARAWEAHEAELRGHLPHRMAHAEAADDVLQDVFVKAMRQGPALCNLDNPRAWPFHVARNAVVDRLRASQILARLQGGAP